MRGYDGIDYTIEDCPLTPEDEERIINQVAAEQEQNSDVK